MLAEVRQAVASYLKRASSEDAVCGALERLAAQARAERVHAESMLVVFKDVWREAASATGGDTRERNAALSRLVSLCIDRYYAET